MQARLLSRRRWSGVVVLSVVLATTARGQDPGIGRIDDIRGLDASGSCLAPPPTGADRQQLSRVRGGAKEPTWTSDGIRVNDRVLVGRHTDVRVRIETSRFGTGNFFLTPELGRCTASELARAVPSLPDARGAGSYEFRTEAIGSGANARERLVVDIRNGAAVVQWEAGLLAIRALGETMHDSGGAFTVVVDSLARRGIVNVHQGVVTLRDGTVRAAAGHAFTFGPGLALQVADISGSAIQEAHWHTTDVWRATTSDRWRSRAAGAWRARTSLPWKWVGGAAGAAAGVFFLRKAVDAVTPDPKPDVPPLRPIIIVVIPL
jgi:hypothetical protein